MESAQTEALNSYLINLFKIFQKIIMEFKMIIRKYTSYMLLFFILLNITRVGFAESETEPLPDYAKLYKRTDFPAQIPHNLKNRPPLLNTPYARYYRTLLRNAAKETPDFAGNMVVAQWGCGSGCVRLAMVNVLTGEVYFPDFDMFYPDSSSDDSLIEGVAFYYWPDSNLFITIGSQEGWADKPGVYYYKWTGKALKLLKVVKEKELFLDQK